jgi:FkbM family methyltransferase
MSDKVISKMAIQSDLVIDIGLHQGEDTAFYLAKGFRVVSVEADPDLVRECRARFARELSDQRLRIIEGAIAEGGPKVSFYKDDASVWGTVNQDWAKRNEKFGSHNKLIKVGVLDISRIFNDVGIPYYLKLDIEGSEHLVLTAMLTLHDAPPFLSMESEKVSFKKLLWELRTLRKLGYRRFKVVQQRSIAGTTIQTVDLAGRKFAYTFEPAATGPFGDEAAGRWLSYYQACLKYVWIFGLYKLFGDGGLMLKHRRGRQLHRALMLITGTTFPGWYDTHAALAPSR